MKTTFLLIGFLAAFLPARLLAETPNLDLTFPAGEEAGWTMERRVPAKPALVFGADGLRFSSEGFDLIQREWPIGTAPFELSVDLTMTKGRTESFARSRGVVIALSTAPITAITPKDTTIFLVITQTGPALFATMGGSRLGAEKRPGVWHFPPGTPLGGRFATSMAGSGGQDFSVRWPTKILTGTTLRLWCARNVAGDLQFKIFHAEGAAGPWWDATVPAALADIPFRFLTIHTGREAADFADLSVIKLPDGQGNGPADGIITRLQARAVTDGKTRLDESFPAAVLSSDRPVRSRLLDADQLAALRKKFRSPEFANYCTVVLRQATPEVLADATPGQPKQNEAVFALTWALLLTEDKSTYLNPLLAQIDALIGPSDIYPKNASEWPGRLRQFLFIREFWVQNMVALALAYDLVGEDLGPDRRARIRFLLTRMMKSYHALLDDGDWWFGQNPSNTIGVGNGALGVIAVVMREEQPDLSDKTIARALGTIQKLFIGVEADGGCLEGPMYWNYGLGYPMLFGWALRQTTGQDEGLLSSPQVKNATAYLAVNFGGDGKMIPFNDTQPWLVGWPVLAACGTEAGSPLARWMADHMAEVYAAGGTKPEQTRATYSIPAFLYRDTVPAPKEFPGLPNVATLDSIHEGVLRSDGRQLVPALVTGIKGKGARSTHHANEDQGSFVFYADGRMILLDPGYFEPTADRHSLPLLGNPEKMALQPTTEAPLSDSWEQGPLRSLTVDATAAYNTSKKSPPVAKRARRVFVQAGEEALVILDDTVPKDTSFPITAQYQAGVPVEVQGNSAELAGVKGPITLELHGPQTTLVAIPREFRKDWVYKQMGVPWTTLRATYSFDPARPLVTILRRGAPDAPRALVEYSTDAVSVSLPGGTAIRFTKSPSGWIAAR